MEKDFLIGNTNNIAKKPSKILIGNSNNIAKEVEYIFAGNSSNQAVKVYPSSHGLPSEYQECEYILNSGSTQYINTGVKPNSNTRLKIEYEINKKPTSTSYDYYLCIAGTGQKSPENFYRIKVGPSNQSITFDGQNSSTVNTVLNTRFVVDINRYLGYSYINNQEVLYSQSTFSTLSNAIILFGYNDWGTIHAYWGEIRVYNCRIWQDGVMIRDMYPCYLKSNPQNVGMYNVVDTGQYYGNSGTSFFYKGPDV